MKILMVSNMYPSSKYPQYGIFVQNVEQILKRQGIEIKRAVLYKQNNKIIKLLSYIKFYFYTFFLALLGNYDYIYVHYISHSSLGVLLAKKIRTKLLIISNVHGSDAVPENKRQYKFNKITQVMLSLSDKVIAPSVYYKNLIHDEYYIELDKIYVSPSGGINPKVFYSLDRKESLSQLNLDSSFNYMGYVGRIEYQKGWDILLDAFRKIEQNQNMMNYKLIFVGNGKQKEEFDNLVVKYNLQDRIIHIDFLHQDKLKYVYNAIDLFCFPTMRKGESLGLVGIEALACGTPVIASNFAGPKEYIQNDYNGFLFSKGDSNELANKVQSYINLSIEEKERLSRNALHSSVKYQILKIEEEFINIFK